MKCETCGRQYDLQEAEERCKSYCRSWGNCGITPCPGCFAEKVEEPGWYHALFNAGAWI
ncbi:MAG TPA: hypothetical protein VL404_09915 [Candidatus Eisenbacteria bacterium]|jgi:hypothetical protein|nr:hypothetical protein [Candidatus Eisenbacteria bacterium]